MMEDRAPRFHALPGLVRKYHVREADGGEYSGICIWDGEESSQSIRGSELARSIPAAYRVVGKARVETFELPFPLRAGQRDIASPRE
jgi:hypothetical protein